MPDTARKQNATYWLCAACGYIIHRPLPLCPRCSSSSIFTVTKPVGAHTDGR